MSPSLKIALSLILQRYYFESNSQLVWLTAWLLKSCHWYCKDTILKAIHNLPLQSGWIAIVVTDIAKILFWKQFTTANWNARKRDWLSLILQRYYFESNSQHRLNNMLKRIGCHWYCKDTILKAIHNLTMFIKDWNFVVTDIAKILFWKQFTTGYKYAETDRKLSLILQRYYFESNSQQHVKRDYKEIFETLERE